MAEAATVKAWLARSGSSAPAVSLMTRVRDITPAYSLRSPRLAHVLHAVFTSLLVLVTVFTGWFSAYVVYRLYRGSSGRRTV
jgi:hypothetical protein